MQNSDSAPDLGNSDDIAKNLDNYSARVDTALTAFNVRH
jgi:hypothetical protein